MHDRFAAACCILLAVACGDDGVTDGGGGAGGGASGGSGSGGAAPGAVRECTADEDCIIQDDCCACAAVPSGSVGPCEGRCRQSWCSSLGIEPEAVCSAGQCVFATSCNATTVACNGLPPDCAAGSVASVDGLCWGPCIPASECREVTTCADCGALACLEEVAFTVTHQCIATAEACPAGPTCECLAGLCYENDVCMPGSEADVSCECINC